MRWRINIYDESRDDVNKDRVSRGLEYDDDESDDEIDVLNDPKSCGYGERR